MLDTTSNYMFLAAEPAISNSDTDRTNCGIYTNFYGWKLGGNFKLRYLTPFNTPHYSLRFVAWMLLADDWLPTDTVYVTNRDNNINVMQSVSTISNTEECSNNLKDDHYLKLDVEVPHTTTTVDLMLYTTNSKNNDWGIDDYYMLIALCDPVCLKCTGPTNTTCSQCVTNYWLSGSTCDVDCLPGYGASSTPYLCLVCSLYCQECSILSTRCSACTVDPPY